MEKLLKILALMIVVVGLGLTLLTPKKALAQVTSLGISTYLPIIDKKVENGDIIVTTPKGYALSSIAYDGGMIGVVTTGPAISLKTSKDQKGFPVAGSGIAYVKVTGTTGNIKKGDFITSSSVRGTGMKAEGSGFVVGSALDDAAFKKETDTKIIQVSVNPHYASSSLSIGNSFLDIFKIGKLAAAEKPAKVLQYLVAGLITLVTFGAGFAIFAKAVNTGMEAMGRNPLAGRQIQFSIVINVVLIVVIIVAGTSLAYLVIRL